ncbi:VOC family protein [Dyella subtropica]|uniref:VOC family protein n=1 Tax=Dyella subtropica TaxID=2992127 RepID=UPI002B1CD73A|nr:VOC family protein [Dyella subtropica]
MLAISTRDSLSVRFRPELDMREKPFVGRNQKAFTVMHHSRLCALLIDCNGPDVDKAAGFWAEALGRAIDPDHPGTRGNYRMLETPPDEPIVQIQRVSHESRVHIDIETDDISAEVLRLERLGATVVSRLERWVVMQAPTGQRFCVVRVQRPGFPKNANRWD